MDSPPAFGHCWCREFEPATHDPVPRPKRLLDSMEQAQALQSAKKVRVGGCHCSIPDPPSHFLDDTGHDDLVASSAASKYDDVAISLDTTPCFDDSEPDDSLLELSESEGGNSPFSYTEEEIQEILADDCVESERYLSRKSALSQNGNAESEKDESSNSSTGTSVLSNDTNVASEITETPNVSPSRQSSSLNSECYPSLSNGSASLDENQLQSAQVTLMLFDLDIQELLSLSLSLSLIDADDVGEPLEDGSLEEAEREASKAIANDCLECEKAAGSCALEESAEGLMSEGRQSPDCPGETPVTSRDVSNIRGDRVERSVSSSGPACGQSAAEESSAPTLPTCPTPSSESRNQELPKAKSCFSRKLDFLEDDEGESTEAEQPSNSIKLSNTAVGQIGQEEMTSAKKPGKVIPVPQEEEERLNQWMCILDAELELKKPLHPECAHLCEENGSSYSSCRLGIQPDRQRGLSQLSQKSLPSGLIVTLDGPSVHLGLQRRRLRKR